MDGTVQPRSTGKQKKRLVRLAETVNAARTMVERGEAVQLETLAGSVESVCADILQLPDRQRRKCRDPLISLIEDFDRLEVALRTRKGEAGNALGRLSEGRRAATAYGGKAEPRG